ncbi:MAG: DUF711 family protein [Candidatus Thermoplasmatota archaeon]
MKIRSITIGTNLDKIKQENKLKKLSDFSKKITEEFEQKGFPVQTVRLTLQHDEKHFKNQEKFLDEIKKIQSQIEDYGWDYFNIGTINKTKNIVFLDEIYKNTTNCFTSIPLIKNKKINYEKAKKTAFLIKKLSKLEKNGFANLRLAVHFNVKPGGAFYPASYHKGKKDIFAIATENSDLLHQSFSKNNQNIKDYFKKMKKIFSKEYKKIEKISKKTKEKDIKYGGIDCSICPSVKPENSIAYAFEKIGLGKFGKPGTLYIAKNVTETIKKIPVNKCGYNGLMLPVLEDYGLAERNKQGYFDLKDLLSYSSVCGTGLDTIPLPGNVSHDKIYSLLLDIAALSLKLEKPLSARLMPIPNKKTGDLTEFDFEYFKNTSVMKI